MLRSVTCMSSDANFIIKCYSNLGEWVGPCQLGGFPLGFPPSVRSVGTPLVYGMLSMFPIATLGLFGATSIRFIFTLLVSENAWSIPGLINRILKTVRD